MAGEWETLPVAEAPLEIIDGDRGVNYPKQEDFGPSGDCLFLNTGNVTTTGFNFADRSFITKEKDAALRKGKLKRHDVVLTTRGTVGNVALFDDSVHFEDVRINSGMVLLRAEQSKLLPRFLFQFVRSPLFKEQVAALTTGSAQPQLPIRDIRRVEIPLPPLAEQKAIAAVLGALDDKIELNRRMNATLEAMARALFQSWFVDFDPVRRNKEEGGRIKDEISTLFPDSFQESALGLIPKGWEVTTLGACIGFRSGFSFKSQDWQESGVPVVKIGSVKPGIIDLSQVSYVSEDIAQQAARYRLGTGDMLIGMTGYVGEVGLIPPSDNPPLLNQRVGKFVMAKAGTESLAFWYCATRQPEFKTFVEARSHGTAQANVSGESIMEFPLVVPRAELLDEFNRKCQPLLDRILANYGESRTLATLRDTLLPKLMSSELSVAKIGSHLV